MLRDAANRRRLRVCFVIVVVLGATLLLSSCAAGPNPSEATGEPAGFWLGLWHGIILPVTFVVSLFTDDVSLYEVANNGNWYDFGFFVGVAMSLGGSGGAGSRARKRS